MITFLPFADFRESAKSLDRQRLGKQRAENLEIWNLINGSSNHPAVRMWRGYSGALCAYSIEICGEWIRRGYIDNTILKWYPRRVANYEDPWWLGREELHKSHRSKLIQKLPEWYRDELGWKEPVLPYFWPMDHVHV